MTYSIFAFLRNEFCGRTEFLLWDMTTFVLDLEIGIENAAEKAANSFNAELILLAILFISLSADHRTKSSAKSTLDVESLLN